jgi:hypothetical protein
VISCNILLVSQQEKIISTTNQRGNRQMESESIKSVVVDHVINNTIWHFGHLLLKNSSLQHGGVQRIRAYPFDKGPCMHKFHTKNPLDVVGIVPDAIENVSSFADVVLLLFTSSYQRLLPIIANIF